MDFAISSSFSLKICIFAFRIYYRPIYMHTILLSIGSNIYAKNNIDKAKRMLLHYFPDIVFTSSVLSEPYEDKYIYPFRNILATFQSDLSPAEIIQRVKLIESAVGRSPRDRHSGKVVIDIDLLKYDDAILRPADYERRYVQELLLTL